MFYFFVIFIFVVIYLIQFSIMYIYSWKKLIKFWPILVMLYVEFLFLFLK